MVESQQIILKISAICIDLQLGLVTGLGAMRSLCLLLVPRACDDDGSKQLGFPSVVFAIRSTSEKMRVVLHGVQPSLYPVLCVALLLFCRLK